MRNSLSAIEDFFDVSSAKRNRPEGVTIIGGKALPDFLSAS